MTLVVTMPALSEPVQCLSQNWRGDALDKCRKLMNARAEFCEPRVLLARGGHVHFTESGHVRCTLAFMQPRFDVCSRRDCPRHKLAQVPWPI
jgi:hypothetical protein